MYLSDSQKYEQRNPHLGVSAAMDHQDPKGSVLNDISMYENSYNSRVIYSRKLYFMLLIQMIIIGALTYAVYADEKIHDYLQKNQVIFWISVVICVGTATFVLLFRRFSRARPLNYILFMVFSLSVAFSCAYLVAIGDSEVGLLVFSSLASIIFFLFLYSLTVKKRLTYQGSTLFLSGSILLVFELFTIFTDVSLFWLMVVSLVSFLFAYFLIYDTQTNVNSGDRYDVTLEDEVSGSVVVYWDVILLFLHTSEMIRDYVVRERN